MGRPVIVSACRTAMGAFQGGLAPLAATRLGALAVEEALSRSGLAKDQVDEVILGNVLQANLGQNPARQALIGASGARILTTLLYALKDRGLSRGLAGLCLGGGNAVVTAVEMC